VTNNIKHKGTICQSIRKLVQQRYFEVFSSYTQFSLFDGTSNMLKIKTPNSFC